MLHFQPEPERHHPLGHRGYLTEPVLHLLVLGDALLVLPDLLPGQPGHVGWIAQLNEMISDPEYKIGRPRQLYSGAAPRTVKPIGER